MAGKSAESPATKSLEFIFNPGRWLFRVKCNDGVMLYTTPSLAKESNEHAAGTRKQGEYVRGVELRQGEDDGSSLWLKLDVDEDRDGFMGVARDFLAHGYLSNNFDYTHSRRHLWICVEGGNGTRYLQELNQEDSPVLDLKHVGDATRATTANPSVKAEESYSIVSGGDLFDQPFISRVGDVSLSTADSAMLLSVRGGIDDDVVCNIEAQAKQSYRNRHTVIMPPGEAVTITGLATANEIQYNNVDGVVVTSLDADGCMGIRLNSPFSGKVVSMYPSNIVLRPMDTDDESDTIDMISEASSKPWYVPLVYLVYVFHDLVYVHPHPPPKVLGLGVLVVIPAVQL